MEESIIEKMIEEYKELKKYKKECEHLKVDKKKMADALFDFELKEYHNTSYEDRVKKYQKEFCQYCRYFYGKNNECKWLEGTPNNRLPDDILKPIRHDTDFFPAHKGCKDYLSDL